MKFYSIFLIFLLTLLYIPLVLAAPPITSEFVGTTGLEVEANLQDYYKINEGAEIHIFVFNKSNGQIMTGSDVSCRVELTDANGTIVLEGAPTADGDHFHMSRPANIVTKIETYGLTIVCNNSKVAGYKTDFFEANVHGIASDSTTLSESLNRAIYSMLAIGLILMLGFFFYAAPPPVKWTLFMISITFLLIAINLIGVIISAEPANASIADFFSGFTVISFYFYWFAGGLLIIMWGFTFFNTWFLKANIEQLKNYGIE